MSLSDRLKAETTDLRMREPIAPPSLLIEPVDASHHRVTPVDDQSAALQKMPRGASVMELWSAAVSHNAPPERAYIAFNWMRPMTNWPVVVAVGAVIGVDPQLVPGGSWQLFYRARWTHMGVPVSPWSTVIVVAAGDAAHVPDQAAGGPQAAAGPEA